MADITLKIDSDGFDIAKKNLQDVETKIDELKSKLQSISGVEPFAGVNKSTARVNDNMRGLQRRTQSVYKQNRTLAMQMKETGRRLDYFGSKLLPVNLALIGLGTAVFKVGMKFESAFAGIEKTVDSTDSVLSKLRTNVINMSKEIPVTANELASIGEIGGQLGIPIAQMTKFTEVVAKLGVATNLTSEESATMLAQFMNVMKVDFSNIDKLGSVLVDLGNNIPATEKDILSMSQRFSSVAGVMRFSAQETMGWSGAMASLGINVEEGGSALGRVILKMNDQVKEGSDDLKTMAKVSGMTSKEFSKMWSKDKSQALDAYIKGLHEADKSGKDITTTLKDLGIVNTRDRNVVMKLASGYNSLSKSLKISKSAYEKNNALEIEAEKRFGTTESKLQLLKNQLTATAIAIYDKMRPAIHDTLDSLLDFAKGVERFFKSLKPETLATMVKLFTTFATSAFAMKGANIILQTTGNILDGFSKVDFGSFKQLSKVPTMFKTMSAQKGGLYAIKNIFDRFSSIIPLVSVGVLGASLAFKALFERINANRDLVNTAFDNINQGVNEKSLSSWENLTTQIGEFKTEMQLANLQTSTFNRQDFTEGLPDNIALLKQSFTDYVDTRLQEENKLVSQSQVLTNKEKNAYLKTVGKKYSDYSDIANGYLDKIAKIQGKASNEGRSMTGAEINKAKEYYRKYEEFIQNLDLTPKTETDALLEQAKIGLKLDPEQQAKVSKSLLERLATEMVNLNNQYNTEGTELYHNQKAFIDKSKEALDDWVNSTAEAYGLTAEEVRTGRSKVYNEVTGMMMETDNATAGMYNAVINNTKNAAPETVKATKEWADIFANTIGNGFKKVEKTPTPDISGKTKKIAKTGNDGLKIFDYKKTMDGEFGAIKNVKDVDVSNKGEKAGKTLITGINKIDALKPFQKKVSAVKNVKTPDTSGIGRDIGRGVGVGISSIDISGFIQSFVNKIPEKLRKFLGINSPAKLVIPEGKSVAEGVGVGIIRGIPYAVTAVGKLARAIETETVKQFNAVSNTLAKHVTGVTNKAVSLGTRVKTNSKTGLVTQIVKPLNVAQMTTAQLKNERIIAKDTYGKLMANPELTEEDKEALKKYYTQYFDELEQAQAEAQELANAESVRDNKLNESKTKRNKEVEGYKKTRDDKIQDAKDDYNNLKKRLQKGGLTPNEKKLLEKARIERDNDIQDAKDKYSDKVKGADKRQAARDLLIEQNYELDVSAIEAQYGSLEEARRQLEGLGYTVDFIADSNTLKVTGKSDDIDNSTTNITLNTNVDEQKIIEILYKQKKKEGK